MQLYPDSTGLGNEVPQRLAERYEAGAGRYWDTFYKRHADKFFKDRHYFDREFPELLLQGKGTVLEVRQRWKEERGEGRARRVCSCTYPE